MSSIASIMKMVSGTNAAQKGLQVVGHNISNVNTKGYTRQQLLQHETGYQNIGYTASNTMQVGYGVSCTEIRQLRDAAADRRFREENSVLSYYKTQTSAMKEIEAILDEPYGSGISVLLNKLSSQANKLNTNPSGVENRQAFISAAKVLIDKINNVNSELQTYQHQIDSEIKGSVDRVNEIIDKISEYNEIISLNEVNGDNANDYRDQRNMLLDELSQYGEITYEEGKDRRVEVEFEGHIVVKKNFTNKIKLVDIEGANAPFKKAVWSDTGADVYKFDNYISPTKQNDTGKLRALFVARGEGYVSWEKDASGNIVSSMNWSDIAFNDKMSVDTTGNAFVIPKVLKQLQDFTSYLVDMTNTSFNGTGIGDYKGVQGVEVFKFNDQKGIYEINQELLTDGGHNKLGTVASTGTDGKEANINDNSKVQEFIDKWSEKKDWYRESPDVTQPHYKVASIPTYFAEFLTGIGTDCDDFSSMADQKNASTMNIDNERQAMGGVSQDEELTYMLKYQYAYNASARVITLMDSMLDTIVNKL